MHRRYRWTLVLQQRCLWSIEILLQVMRWRESGLEVQQWVVANVENIEGGRFFSFSSNFPFFFLLSSPSSTTLELHIVQPWCVKIQGGFKGLQDVWPDGEWEILEQSPQTLHNAPIHYFAKHYIFVNSFNAEVFELQISSTQRVFVASSFDELDASVVLWIQQGEHNILSVLIHKKEITAYCHQHK